MKFNELLNVIDNQDKVLEETNNKISKILEFMEFFGHFKKGIANNGKNTYKYIGRVDDDNIEVAVTQNLGSITHWSRINIKLSEVENFFKKFIEKNEEDTTRVLIIKSIDKPSIVYRQFTDLEMFNLELGTPIILCENGKKVHIGGIVKRSKDVMVECGPFIMMKSDHLLHNCKFEDGSPCGVLIEG